jgi:hypothetical protein
MSYKRAQDRDRLARAIIDSSVGTHSARKLLAGLLRFEGNYT